MLIYWNTNAKQSSFILVVDLMSNIDYGLYAKNLYYTRITPINQGVERKNKEEQGAARSKIFEMAN